jgi:hypothetical protein
MKKTLALISMFVFFIGLSVFAGDEAAKQPIEKPAIQVEIEKAPVSTDQSAAATERPWFDPEKCAFCKTMMAEPGLMEHMKTQYHNLEAGIISLTFIDKEYQPAFKRAHENMQKLVAGMASGQIPYMCEHCSLVGQFHMMNVKFETVEADFGNVMLWTSAEAPTVAKLQAFGALNNEEAAKWQAKAKQTVTE